MTRGFAFVRYYRKRDAEEAMRKLDGERLDGRVLSIQMAKYARPSSRRSNKRDDYSRRRGRSRYVYHSNHVSMFHYYLSSIENDADEVEVEVAAVVVVEAEVESMLAGVEAQVHDQ